VVTLIRLAIALAIFSLMMGWEFLSPRRAQGINRRQRWPVNLGLAAFNMLAMRFSVGGAAYGCADYAQVQGFGLLNVAALPDGLSIAVALLGLDFAIYCQHIAAHRWPLLWRLHQIHHSDLAFDVTTAVRFHPLEIGLSMLYKAACVCLIGASPLAVLIFEVLLNGAATFNHSNVQLPPKLEKALRWLIITPDLHRIHHSIIPSELNSNYGFSISAWDRLFKTYTAAPQQPHATMAIGLASVRNAQALGLVQLLRWPFAGRANVKRRH
jgi:sterol desaturase/sphingolipid hydroxylase (fatty acid hydroxylase superfamily)